MGVMHICRREDGKLLAVVSAESAKEALLNYHETTLTSYGYNNPKIVGSVLTVTRKRQRKEYRAVQA